MNSNGVKGGQGRSDDETEATSQSMFAIIVVAAVVLIVMGAMTA